MDRMSRVRTRWGEYWLALTAVVLTALTGCGGANEQDVASLTGSGQGGITPSASPAQAATPSPTPFGALGQATGASRISFEAGTNQIDLVMFDDQGRCIINKTTTIVALVGNFEGHPVEKGTAIAFFIERGRGIIERQVLTDENGVATATFQSLCPPNAADEITLVAAVRGAEPFTDLNSNGIHDANEPFVDLPVEAFLDSNRNGTFEPDLGDYMIWDPNNNGKFDQGDGCAAGDELCVPDLSGPICKPQGCGNGKYDTDNIITAVAVVRPMMPTPGPQPSGTLPPEATPTSPPTGTPAPTGTPTPPAVSIELALFVNQASDNGDGTLSSVVSALVTGSDGVAVGDGVVVRFSLAQPVLPGVSVTSPGLTGDAPGCTLSFPVVPQHGDALTCIKYGAEHQGDTVTIQAVVDLLSGTKMTSQTIKLPNVAPFTPTPTTTPGQVAVLQFISAQPAIIGVKGSGLPNLSTLTFQVTDAVGKPVSGVPVNFSVLQVADETLAPTQAVTDTNGNVQVVLHSGERALSVQVTAQITNPPLTVNSTAVEILGGPPSQQHFSIAAQFLNISGRVKFGLTDTITAFVGDRFGNPAVPSAVSFTTTGGTIGNPTPTTDSLGQASATLVSQKPVPSNGIVTTLATTHGERPFVDANANGVCDDGEQLVAVSEPFYDTNCNGVHDDGEDFIDLNGNAQFDADQGSGTPACTDTVVLFDNICLTFSGHTMLTLTASGSGPVPAGGTRDYTLTVIDDLGNPIVGGSTIDITTNGRARLLGPAHIVLPDVETLGQIIEGVNRFHFSVSDNNPSAMTLETDAVIVTVTSDNLPAGGNGGASATDLITFLANPPPTGTPIPSPTPVPSAPMIAPSNITLAAGSGAPPSLCNGGTQSFVVTGVNPPFSISGGGGCVSANSLPTSGASFVFTAGNIPGTYQITVTDAVGKTAAASVMVQGPPTPTPEPPTITPTSAATTTPTPGVTHLTIAPFVNTSCTNMDGTRSAPLTAIVTDSNGVAVGNGTAVFFVQLPPVLAGVAITSPGITGAILPCILTCMVVPQQPGDALSCVKYDQSLGGQSVTVQASVLNPPGPPLTATRTFTLP